MKRTNWKVIKHDFETSNTKLKDLANKYHVNVGTLRSHKSRGKWSRDNKSSHHKSVATKRNKNTTLHKNVATKIHPDLLDNDKLSERQRAFAYYDIKYFGDAYQAAIKAGYSKNTAIHAKQDILENPRLHEAVNREFKIATSSDSRCHASFADVLANQLNIGAGIRQRRRYQTIDNRDPSQSTDVTLIGSPGIRDQVNAGKTLIQFQHQTDLNKAQIAKMNAETQLTKSKLPDNKNHRKRVPMFWDDVIKHHEINEKKYKNRHKS